MLVGAGEAALGAIKVPPYYAWAYLCVWMYVEKLVTLLEISQVDMCAVLSVRTLLTSSCSEEKHDPACRSQSFWERCSCLKQFDVQGLVFSSDCYNTAAFQGQGLLTFAICCIAMNSAAYRKQHR